MGGRRLMEDCFLTRPPRSQKVLGNPGFVASGLLPRFTFVAVPTHPQRPLDLVRNTFLSLLSMHSHESFSSAGPGWHVLEVGSGEPLVILHGVFGSGDNWMSIARRLEQRWKVYLPDQRNHGKSFRSEEFGYDLLAGDLLEWMDTRGLEAIHLLGHSMGGKAAMRFAAIAPHRLKSLVVVDIARRAYRLDTHRSMLEAMKALDLAACTTRSDLDRALQPSVPEEGTRLFILKNIERDSTGAFRWRIALDPLLRSLDAIGTSLAEHAPIQVPCLVIRGRESGYVSDADFEQIARCFPQSRLVTIEGAGHWVHADRPNELTDALIEFWSPWMNS